MSTRRLKDNLIFDPNESLPRNELQALQLDRLRGAVERAKRVPH